MKNNFYSFLAFIFIVVLFPCAASLGQISKSISSISNTPPLQNTDVTFNIEIFQANTVSRISFFYKSFGESAFKSREVILSGVRATVTIPKEEVTPPIVEYYFMIELTDGNIETYPIDYDKTRVPLSLKVETQTTQQESEILLLSPEEGFKGASDELLISISLLRANDNIKKEATKILIDENDVSANALFAGDLINYYPDNFSPKLLAGVHSFKIVLYDTLNKISNTYKSEFTILSKEEAVTEKSKFNYRLRTTAEARNEKYGDASTFYNNLGINFNGEYEDWRINSSIYLTSEEKSYLQPYNRYNLTVQNSFLTFSVGDIFPRFSSLIMDGKRIRGVFGDIKTGSFEIKSAYGEITRGTDGRLLEKFTSQNAPLGTDIIDIDSIKYPGFSKGRAVLGAYKRNLLALRAALGNESGFIWGLSYLHAKDDIESIEFGARPKENLVLGTDFSWAIDNKNIILTAQGAMNLSNNDITYGELSDALIDTVFKKDGGFGGKVDSKKIKDIKNIFGNFIIVNQYIVPFNPLELPTLAAETALQMNYLDNNFRVSYLYRGNDFQSFGQQYIRTDIAGINISDRARLVSDKVFVSLNYEQLKDNLQNTKFATTTFQTFGTSVSFFPRNELPNFVVGYNRYKNDNDIDTTNIEKKMYYINDITNRFFTQISYDFVWNVKHQASFNISISDRTDNSPLLYDVSSTSTYFSLNSYWNPDLMTFFNVSVNNSKIKNIEVNYSSFTIGGKQALLEKKLEIMANISPIFGDLKRVSYDVSARYIALVNLDFTLQLRLLTYSEASNDIIAGLTARYGLN